MSGNLTGKTILYVDQTGKLGGGELALLPWLEANAEGARVVLFTDGPFRERIEAAGVPVTVLRAGSVLNVRRESGISALLGILPGLLRLRRELAGLARQFEVIYANSQKAFFLSALAKRRGQPLVWHLRDILSPDHFSPLMRWVAVMMGNRFASVILVNSQASADAFIGEGGDASKVSVVHDGVSAAPFDAVSEAQVQALRAAILPTEALQAPLIGVFGRLSPWKGQHIVLEAVRDLPSVHVVLVGDALFGEDAYVKQLESMVGASELAGRVHFLGFREDVPALMKAVDLVVHASTAAEPFGLVIVEGMLAGKPVIATRAGGAREIIEDGESGLLVSPGSSAEMRFAMERLGQDRELRSMLSQAGRARAGRFFSVAAMRSGIARAIERLPSAGTG
jgi:glycosyltransferase involved in cell wall biosynthesis